MISVIRKGLKNKVFKIILWMTLFSVVGGVSLFPIIKRLFFKEEISGIATINGEAISIDEFRRNYAPLALHVQNVRKMYGKQAEFVLSLWGIDLKKESLEQIVINNIARQKAIDKISGSSGFTISKDFMFSKLNDPVFSRNALSDYIPPQAYQNGSINMAVLTNYLEHSGISEKEFENILHQTLNQDFFVKLIQGGLYLPQQILKDEYIKSYSNKKYSLVSVSMDKYLEKEKLKTIPGDEINAYFEKHKDEYRVPEKRSGKLWVFDLNNYEILVSDKEIEKYYKQNRKDYLESPEEVEIKRILIRINNEVSEINAYDKAQGIRKELESNPEKFDTILKREGQSGSLKVVKGEKEPHVEKRIFRLKTGEVSLPIKTKEGFEIVKLISRKLARYSELSKIKDSIKVKIKNKKFINKFNSDVHRVLSQSKDVPSIFENFIKNKKSALQEIGNIEQDGTKKSEVLFGLEFVGKKSYYTENGKGFIVELLKINKSYIPELSKVEKDVLNKLYRSKAKNLLKKDLQKLSKKIEKDFDQTVKNIEGSFKISNWINPQNSDSFKKFAESIPVNVFLSLDGPKENIIHIDDKNGYLITLLEINKFNLEDFKKKKDLIEQKLQQQEFANLGKSFINFHTQQIDIKINDNLLKVAR